MLQFKRRRARFFRQPSYPKKDTSESSNKTMDCSIHGCDSNADIFTAHISNYIGETVTIFVNGGGTSGFGFTGVLLDVNNIFLRLIVRFGSPPVLPFESLNSLNCYPARNIHKDYWIRMGSIACIPLSCITAFVHNIGQHRLSEEI